MTLLAEVDLYPLAAEVFGAVAVAVVDKVVALAEVFVVGGTLNRNSRSMYGQSTTEQLSRVRIDQAFMGVTGYDENGFNCGHAEENALKRFLVSRAGESVLLMDSSKVGKSSTFTFCTLDQADVLVSDGNLPEEFRMLCEKHNVTVV